MLVGENGCWGKKFFSRSFGFFGGWGGGERGRGYLFIYLFPLEQYGLPLRSVLFLPHKRRLCHGLELGFAEWACGYFLGRMGLGGGLGGGKRGGGDNISGFAFPRIMRMDLQNYPERFCPAPNDGGD